MKFNANKFNNSSVHAYEIQRSRNRIATKSISAKWKLWIWKSHQQCIKHKSMISSTPQNHQWCTFLLLTWDILRLSISTGNDHSSITSANDEITINSSSIWYLDYMNKFNKINIAAQKIPDRQASNTFPQEHKYQGCRKVSNVCTANPKSWK